MTPHNACPDLDDRLWSMARPSPRGARPTLARMQELLDVCGHPERDLAAIHVGGTSGKGSTCHLIAAALNAAGLPAGMHTKPHLHTVRERLALAGQPIGCAEFAALLDAIAPLLDHVSRSAGRPTWFELVVALAFRWFRDRGAHPVIVEVGLGGSWDATNVLQPLVAVLTNVDLDHTDVLGDTVELIALDKVGILKAGAMAITGATQPAVRTIVEARAHELGIPLWRLGDEIRLDIHSLDGGGARFDLTVPGETLEDLHIGLLGRHQAQNAALAGAALIAARRQGIAISDAAIRSGMATCRVPGRLEYVPGEPPIVLDGAHNPQKMEALAAALRLLYPDTPPVCVVAMRRGHDPAATLAPLRSVAKEIVLTRLTATTDWGAEQSVDPATLANAIGPSPVPVQVQPGAIRALEVARELAGPHGLVCVTGSLYLVGEVRASLTNGL